LHFEHVNLGPLKSGQNHRVMNVAISPKSDGMLLAFFISKSMENLPGDQVSELIG
jgi:hypothetical protein